MTLLCIPPCLGRYLLMQSLFYLFTSLFWLCWVFAAAHRLSLVAVRGLLIMMTSLVAEHELSSWWVVSVAPQYVGNFSSPTRDWTRVPCIRRQILNHWTTREVPVILSFLAFFSTFSLPTPNLTKSLKEFLGLEKKTTVSKALAESSNFGEKQNQTLTPALMLRAGYIYLGLITSCRKPPTPGSNTNAISTKDYPKHPAWLKFPLSLPQTSL